ncbi:MULTISPECIES: portal protein [unclassified Vibrio]|uniref:portal protein n=1 Tax=unclassified Vibrio TaxID=2614977 RepID=UPI0013611281|nr:MULTISPECIES: portal protein [unclassified Vibrio]NAW60060.1 phage tail protein [Vibrio sp. V36_P2S2PM302]NAX25983.1 phage tail protein [Vibrio sp. V38_P2S17PM301]NAX30661.1 phage tail protein [Vibrio sp. V37_P2S8PM304]
MIDNEIRKRSDGMFSQLDNEYTTWEPHYRDIAMMLNPRRQRFNVEDSNRHSAVNSKIVDPSATIYLRTAMGGMYSGITNPTMKWLRFNVADKDLNKRHSVRLYLDQCAEIVLKMLFKTNFYNSVPSVFMDILSYSTSSIGVEKDEYSVLRFFPNPIGSYRIATNDRLSVNTHAKKRMWTADQLVRRFGLENVSEATKSAYSNHNYQQRFEVRHLVFDNPDFIPTAFSGVHKEFASVWYQPDAEEGKILSRSGFDEFPFFCPRWEALGADVYGSFGPGMLALGSIKGLQVDQRNKHTANALQIKPPMVGPSTMKNSGASLVPGGITFVDGAQGVDQFKPAFATNFSTSEALASIADTREIIKQAFFYDLFLTVIDVQKSGVTAYEIAQRKEEKMIMLGPVLSRFDEEFLDPTVSLGFRECHRRGMLPDPPLELDGVDIQIEYMGMLHQAQKSIGIASIERTLGFYGNMAAVFPQVLDKVNIDAAADIYADITGTTPEILNDEETVKNIREGRAQAQQREQLAAMAQPAQQGAAAAKLMSEVDVSSANGLTNMLGI